VVPLCLTSGRIIGILRLCDMRISGKDRKELEDSLRVVGTLIAETYFCLRRGLVIAKPVTCADEQPLILMTTADGRLDRFHGSASTVLGRGESTLRTYPCWKWIQESDVWTAVTQQIFFGSASQEQQVSSIHARNMYWIARGNLCVADLYAVPFYVEKMSPTNALSHCFFSISNRRIVQGTVFSPVCFVEDNIVSLDFPRASISRRRSSLSRKSIGGDGPTTESEAFVLGVRLTAMDTSQEDVSFDDEWGSSIMMKIMEVMHKYGGEIFCCGMGRN